MAEVVVIDQGMKTLEDFIDGAVSAILPALDHSLVIPVDGEVPTKGPRVDEVAANTFKATSLCTADIVLAMEGFPTWNESPGSPSAVNNDDYADIRACIREYIDIEWPNWGWDGSTKEGLLQDRKPPVQVWGDSFVGQLGYMRIMVTGGEHGLQVGEVSVATWDNQTGVKQFTI